MLDELSLPEPSLLDELPPPEELLLLPEELPSVDELPVVPELVVVPAVVSAEVPLPEVTEPEPVVVGPTLVEPDVDVDVDVDELPVPSTGPGSDGQPARAT